MRDLNKIISFLLSEIIPVDQQVRSKLEKLVKDVYYTPPECQNPYWLECSRILWAYLGDPQGTPWKERVLAVFSDHEKIPDAYWEESVEPTAVVNA